MFPSFVGAARGRCAGRFCWPNYSFRYHHRLVLYRLREHKEQLESHYPSTWSMGFENRWSTATVLARRIFDRVDVYFNRFDLVD